MFSLDEHGWEGGAGFLLGLGYLRFDHYLPGVVIFMKIRFAICVLVGLGCRHSIISFPFLQMDLQHQRKKNCACLKQCCFGLGMTISQFDP